MYICNVKSIHKTTSEIAKGIAMMKIKDIKQFLYSDKLLVWNIGFIEDGVAATLRNPCPKIHWMEYEGRGKRWFADPFILFADNAIIKVLVEDFSCKLGKGRISLLTIDRHSYHLIDSKVILDLPYHLSFPFIYRYNGNVYIMPEYSGSNKSIIYKYYTTNDTCEEVTDVVNIPLTDATISTLHGKPMVWSTSLPTQNGNVLSFYDFDPSTLRITNKIGEKIFHSNIARNAGAEFSCEGKTYRPAQDCNKRYGGGIILQEVTIGNNGDLHFNDVSSIYPHSWKLSTGIHTFNTYNDLIVVDGQGYLNPIAGRIVSFVNRIRSTILTS